MTRDANFAEEKGGRAMRSENGNCKCQKWGKGGGGSTQEFPTMSKYEIYLYVEGSEVSLTGILHIVICKFN